MMKVPSFVLDCGLSEETYAKWLSRKVKAIKRYEKKKKRLTSGITEESLAKLISESNGKDHYTGEQLDWSLLSKYNNDQSKENGRDYIRKFALLPTVDHELDEEGQLRINICGWRTNDCKNHLNRSELIAFCEAVLQHSK